MSGGSRGASARGLLALALLAAGCTSGIAPPPIEAGALSAEENARAAQLISDRIALSGRMRNIEYAIVTAAVFAARVRNGAEPTLSGEHDAARWVGIDEAHTEVIWPGYRTAIERIRDDLVDEERAAWFELTLAGDRRPRA